MKGQNNTPRTRRAKAEVHEPKVVKPKFAEENAAKVVELLIVGESVNFTMMAATIDVVKQEYFNNVTYPSIKKGDSEDGDN